MIHYIGLDFEASGTNPWEKHVPIQIGIYVENQCEINYKIGQWNWKEWEWQEEAQKVHNITQKDLQKEPPVWKVDVLATAALMPFVGNSRMFNIMVGWNVAGYDRQFITRWFPNLNRLLSYRTVDLNALVFALAGDNEAKYVGIKNASKEDAAARIEGADNWHDALYDAKAALYSFEYLRTKFT